MAELRKRSDGKFIITGGFSTNNPADMQLFEPMLRKKVFDTGEKTESDKEKK